MKSVLLTGGAGYIGSHVANYLLDKGLKVTIIDNLTTGNKRIVPKQSKLHICDISDEKKVTEIIKKNNFDIVMHFAGLVRVDESIKNPKKYKNVNFQKGKAFLKTCFQNNLNKIIFSSTASVYGNNGSKKINEKDKLDPMNPYAKSKLNLEKFIIEKSKLNKIQYIILRYFNVAGADKKLRSGLIAKSSTNLIKVICEVAVGKRKKFKINGNDYNTKDGTTVRDFIHVSDLAEMHLIAAEDLINKKGIEVFNCGYGVGYSVQDIINTMNKILKSKINFEYGPRRKGDAEYSVANNDKFIKKFNWKPKYNNLEFILKTALSWEKNI